MQMLLFLIKNWKLLAIAIPPALLALQVLSWRSDAHQLPEAKSALSSCQSSVTATKELNDGLQKSRDSVRAKLDNLKRVHANSCLSIRSDAEQVGAGPAGRNGEIVGTTDDFRQFAAKCADYRNERIAFEQLLSH